MTAAADIAAFLGRHERVLVLTGAGISTASGIPDYRDREGHRRVPTPVQGPEFRKLETVRRRYWARSMVGWRMLSHAQPNAAHTTLARMHLHGLITQNVDGLHLDAGSHDVLELHGNIRRVVCLDCHATVPRALVQDLLESANPDFGAAAARPAPDGDAHLEPESLEGFITPQCIHCGGTLKPDVVFFGDGVPTPCTVRAMRMLEECDALLVVGSSLMVFSGFRFPKMAADAGKPVAAINLGKTRADHLFALKLEQAAEMALPEIYSMMRSE